MRVFSRRTRRENAIKINIKMVIKICERMTQEEGKPGLTGRRRRKNRESMKTRLEY